MRLLWLNWICVMLARDNQEPMGPTRRRPAYWHWCLVAVIVLLFSVYFGGLALRQYDALITGIDLANADQTVWSTVNGQLFRMTTYPSMTNRLGMHVEPILLALVPLYAVAPSAKTLLLVQVFMLGLAAVPLYLLSVEAIGRPTLALAFPLLYMLSPAVHNAALSDFHAVTLGVFPATAALLAVWKGRTHAALLFGGVALMAREDYGLWLVALAAIGWWRTRKRIWVGVALVGLAWFLIAVLVMPSFFVTKQRSVFWDRYLFWLEGPEAWRAQGYLPEKGRYLIMLLLMGGAGALLAPLWTLPALPTLGLNLLSNYPLPVSLDAYYSALIMATLLAASAIGLSRLRRRWQVLVILVLLATALWIHRSEGRSLLAPGYHPPERTTHSGSLQAVLAQVPDDARLSAGSALASHVSQRGLLRIFPARKECDYIVLDVLQDRSRHPSDMRRRILKMLDAEWGVRAGEHGFLLLEKDEPDTRIPESFYTFTRPEQAPQYPAQAVFGGQWELQGFDIAWDYWGRPAVRLYWRALQAPDADWQPAALALDEGGEVLATPDTHPPVALLWLPTSRWEPGRTYVVEMLPFDAPDRVTLVAGVGAPLADPATRLRTADGRDLVPLATLERDQRAWRVYPVDR